jgi:hypothetical protein
MTACHKRRGIRPPRRLWQIPPGLPFLRDSRPHRPIMGAMRRLLSVLALLAAAAPASAQAMRELVVTRTEKADYLPAVALCKEAADLVESDPRTAAEKLTEVIDNPRIRKVEGLLRIELRPSEYTTPYEFTPCRYRGRARMAQAALASTDAVSAVRLLAGAVEDFKKSLEAGVQASEALLREAEIRQKAAQAEPPPAMTARAEDPVLKFKPGWQRLVEQGRYKAALAAVAQAAALPAADRKRFEDDTRRQCSDAVVDALGKFRRSLGGIAAEADLTAMTGAEFARAFALPAPDELVDPPPAHAWAASLAAAFQEIRGGKAAPAALLPAAAGAVPLAEAGEPQWFQAAEPLAFQGLRDAVRKEVDGARDARQAEREAARKRADALLAQWKAFADALAPAFRQRTPAVADHGAQLAKLLEGFPAELKEVDAVDLAACFTATRPDAELEKAERQLKALEGRASPPPSVESRQRLYSRIVVAVALRSLLAGRTEDEAAAALQAYGPKLKAAGGPEDAKRYGPRVEKVFLKLVPGG